MESNFFKLFLNFLENSTEIIRLQNMKKIRDFLKFSINLDIRKNSRKSQNSICISKILSPVHRLRFKEYRIASLRIFKDFLTRIKLNPSSVDPWNAMETRKIHFSRVPIIAIINNNKSKIQFFSFNGRIKYLSTSKHLNIIFFYFSIS